MRRDAAMHAALAGSFANEAHARATQEATRQHGTGMAFPERVGLGVVPPAQHARVTRSYTPGARQ
jgi:hypothetical protein